MRAQPHLHAATMAIIATICATTAQATINVPTVRVGNPGNAPDASGYGSVAYAYHIGQTEVTNAQYAAFLNAVAATDTNGLYLDNMGSPVFGGITRSGSPGAYAYSPISGRANHPVNSVTFWSALRFANWMHNGQPTGAQSATTTEGGAYTLTPGAISSNTVVRNAGWQWAVASENEWYKAAYHQPAAQGGDADGYWRYPTSGNAAPSASQVNIADSGIINTVPVATYAPNFYGAFDMGGNVWEWSDTARTSTSRVVRGGSFGSTTTQLQSSYREFIGTPDGIGANLGFRIVTLVPGPSAASLLALAGLTALRRARRS